MKKIRNLIFVCLFVLTLSLVGCDEKHTMSEEWSKDNDYHWHECKDNDGYVEDKEEHTYGEYVVTVEPTETSTGKKVKTCTVCGNQKFEVIDKLEHTHSLKHIEKVEATCTTDGNIEYYHCEKCDKNYLDEKATQEASNVVINKFGHILTHVDAVDADCTKEGNVEYYHCERCNNNYSDVEGTQKVESVVVAQKEHNLTHHEAVEATYTKEGTLEYYSCDAGCGKNYADSEAKTVLDSIVDPMKELQYGTLESPLTADVAYDEIAKLEGGVDSNEIGYVKGVVVASGSYYNSKNRYYSINIASSSDSSKVIVVFKPTLDQSIDEILIGDEVVVSGKYLRYVKEGAADKIEISSSAQIVSATHSIAVELGTKENPISVAKGVEFTSKLVSGAYSKSKGFVKGYVLSINGNNITIGDAKDATNVLVVYKGTKDESYAYDAINVMDLVVVEAYFQKYTSNNKDTLELSSSPKIYLDHVHEYTVTSVQINPTLTDTGVAAISKCNHCDKEIGGEEIAVLSDESVWTKTETAATYTKKGVITYTSEKYGSIEVEGADKLVAPFANKTYYAVAFDASNSTNKSVSMINSWNEVTLETDENGCGFGEGFPFKGYNVISFIDEETGKVSIKIYDKVEIDKETYDKYVEDGKYFDSKTVTTEDTDSDSMTYGQEIEVTTYYGLSETATGEYVAYVDFATGLIVRPFSSTFDYVVVYTPFTDQQVSKRLNVDYDTLDYSTDYDSEKEDWKDEFYDFTYKTVGTLTNAKASAWSDGVVESMAITYQDGENVKGIFIHDDVVYFDVTFTSFSGETIEGDSLYKATNLVVKQGDEVVKEFVYIDNTMKTADGMQGTYINSDNEKLVLDGAGNATYTAKATVGEETVDVTVKGTYTKTDAVIDGKYYELTLDGSTFTLTYVEVEVTYVDGETSEVVKVNKNVPTELKSLTKEGKVLAGWYLDSNYNEKVVVDENNKYTPTANVTLYAKWANIVKLVVVNNIDGVIETSSEEINAVAGEEIGKYLPEYGLDEAKWAYFAGWYLDSSCEDDYALTDLTLEVSDVESLNVYAKWAKLPAYYGEYIGTNVYGNGSYKVKPSKNLTIDKDGKVSGEYEGNVTAYDTETGIITVVASNRTYYFWFNAEADILVTSYYGTTSVSSGFGYDTYTYVRNYADATNVVVANAGIKYNSTSNYYTKLVSLSTTDGIKTVLYYGNQIYNVESITDAYGNALEVSNVTKNSSLIVYGKDNTVLLAVGTKATSFNNVTTSNTVVALDEYYGIYTQGEQTIKLNGVGGIIIDGVSGTYTVNEDHLDVYVTNDDVTTYYSLTFVTDGYELVKEMANITYSSSQTAVEAVSKNINVSFELPVLENTDTHVFRGWYTDAEFSGSAITSYTATSTDPVTLYAKWVEKVTLTIVYSDGTTENKVVEYGIGETVEVEKPKYEKHTFVKWTDQNGEVFVSGTVINENTTITASWEDAPIYNQKYYFIILKGTSTNGDVTDKDDRSPIIDIDADGYAPNPNTWPFYGYTITITDFDKTTGALSFVMTKGTTTETHKGYVDLVSGIMIVDANKDGNFSSVWMLQPFETSINCKSNIVSSYWNSGKTRTIEYTYDGVTYSAFVENSVVTFGVTFKDANGEAMTADKCYNATACEVFNKNNESIAYYGYNGTTMVLADAYKGTYTNGENSIVLDGIQTIKINDTTVGLANVVGTYSVEKLADVTTVKVNAEGQYFEVSLNEASYTIVKPMVTLTVDLDDGTGVEPTLSVNKNIEYTLPTPTKEGYIFKGYLVGDATTAVFKLTPTADVTIKATWAAKLTLTVVYNTVEGVTFKDTETYEFGSGDTINFTYPTSVINGYMLSGWTYNDESYTLGTITENMTIKAVWSEAVAYTGSYAGFEVWGSVTCGNNGYSSNGKSFTVDSTGKGSGFKTGSFSVNDSGVLKFNSYLAKFDEVNGVLAIDYSSNTTSLSNDLYIFIRGYKSASMTRGTGSAWNSGKNRIIEVQLTDNNGNSSTMLVYVNGTNVYGNVTLESTAGTVTASTAYKMSDFTIKDSQGNVIGKFTSTGSAITEVTE